LLDEPTAGLSAGETSEVGRLVESLHGDLSILLVEHDVDLVLDVADRITVLHEGAVLSEGTPEAVAADQRVQEVYMGR
jgi:ABC-type branched-subunit amino acid transport system ATPase component